MYLLNREILNAFNEDSREIYVKAVFNNEYTIDGDYIKSFTITDSIGNTDALTLGNACSNKLELDMFVPEDFTGLTAAKIEMYIGIEVNGSISYVPLGVFYADNVKSTDNFKSVKITAFDAMLKLNDLGNTYRCGLSGNYVAPINIIKDIASQAGIAVNIPNNPVDTIIRQAEGVLYDSTGTIYESLCSLGVRNLIPLPKYAHDIEIRFKGLPEGMTHSDVRVVYFNDPQHTSVYSTSTYGGMTFGDTFDFEYPDSYVSGTITPPFVDIPLYLGFHLETSQFEDVPDVQIEVIVPNHYVNNGSIPNPGAVDFSARTMLGYMAGRMGCNAVINRSGQLTIQRLNLASPVSIPADIQFMNGFEQSLENALRIEYLTTGTETNESGSGGIITVGQGSYGFNFENPYIEDESEAQNILDLYKDLYIMPGKVKYRGNPSIDCGDLLLVEDRNGDNQNVLVLSQTLTVTGGFNSTIDCSLKTDSKQDFIATPSTKKVTQKFTDFERAYAEVISRLSGVNGGYVKNVYDNYNCIRAIAICESDIAVKWDDTNGKVVVVNSADSGEPMWVWSYGGLSYTPNGGTTYNVAINMDGQIFANYLQSPLGFIGGWILNREKIFQRTKVGSTTYEFTLKSDTSSSSTKKAIYANTFTNDRNSDSADGDNYKTENFYIRRNGEIMLAAGTIAGWNIDEESFYADYDNYRAYIQKPTALKQWVFSTQTKQSDNSYIGTFFVTANGNVTTNDLRVDGKTTINQYLYDGAGYEVMNTNANNALVIGYGQYSHSLPTYLEGGDIYLRVKADSKVYIQDNGSTRFAIGRVSWKLGSETKFSKRDTITSTSGFVLDANGGNNVIGMVASTVYARGNLRISGDTYIGFSAASGTVTLAVNTSGKITVPSSSQRYKENITDVLSDELNPHGLYDCPVVQYNYKPEYKDMELVEGTQIGITAEDLDRYYPNACIYNKDGEPESWQDRIMIPAMLKLIQEQKNDIDELKTQNKELKETLESVLARLDKLEKE